MAKNNHLFTVYHSLDNKGAFDRPSGQEDPEGIQGKYFQEHTAYPKYIRAEGHEAVIVADADEETTVLKAWSEQDVLKQQTKELHEKNKSEFTKNELLAKAKKLGIKADGRWSEVKLAYMIEEAEIANEAKVA